MQTWYLTSGQNGADFENISPPFAVEIGLLW